MEIGNVKLRPATLEDATFVATVMMEAVEIPMMEEGRVPDEPLVDICRRDDTLYSWRNAVIAVDNGKPVGGLISYQGKGYHDTKLHTFSLVPKDFLDFDPFAMDDETKEGEYYLDSLAVLPEYRGRGIATSLLKQTVAEAQKHNLVPVLACDPDNANAYRLYSSLGFREEGELNIFGQIYRRMVIAQS